MRSEQGQALLEVLVATLILTLSITPFLAVYGQTARGAVQSSYREGAVQLAQSVVEQVIAGNPPAPPTGGIYTVNWSKSPVPGRAGLNQVTVTVQWREWGATRSYVLTTYARR